MNRAIVGLVFWSVLVGSAPAQDAFDVLRSGDIPALKVLLEKTPAALEARNAAGRTLLQTAAMGDATDAVAALLGMGASVTARDSYERTSLLLCARERGQEATARLLIDAGSDVNAVDGFGSSVLDLAAWRGKAEVIVLLLERGVELPEGGEKRMGLLTQAASKGLSGLFARLTAGGGGLEAAVRTNPDLLREAASGGSGTIVAALLDAGMAAGAADRFGWTPLHYAARDGRVEAARALVARGAPLDARNVIGQTPYNVAVERKMEPVARVLVEKGADTSAIRFPVLTGDYLGQKPPGENAELFGPGIVSSVWGLHSPAVFSPDGNEVYWCPMAMFPGEMYSRGGLLTMKRVGGAWTPPAPASFSEPLLLDDVPFFSADGTRLYFLSARPLPGADGRKERIWFVDRTGAGWSEPRPLDPAVNDRPMHWSFSRDKTGDLYFGGQGPESRGMSDVYRARFVDGKFEPPVNMGDPISTEGEETTPFVAPDGSYLLFSRQFDIWVSFRQADSSWGAPVKLGPEVNSPAIELGPVVTADGRYLFFLSQRDGESWAYWVSASVIEKVRPFPVLRGEYLGQKQPGVRPEVFAQGVVSTRRRELNSVFSPDGNEFYFTVQEPPRGWTIMVMKQEGGVWTRPRPAEFSGTWSDVDQFLSPDGTAMYFCSNRPTDGGSAPQNNFDIWRVEREGGGWSAPRRLDAPVNSPANEFYPSVSRDGTMVFQSWRAGSRGGRDIYRARLSGGAYTAAETLGPPVSGDQAEGDALISPDGDFIIVSIEQPDGSGAGDLWISFRGDDGSWSEPRTMGGEINTRANENCPVISPDGKFLFYTSAGDIYWVSSQVIDDLRRGNPAGDERGAVERAIRSCIDWAATKDFGRLYGVIAGDADFLEVHPDGTVVRGIEEFRKGEALWRSPEFKAVRHEIRDLRITLSERGDTAWFFCILDDINEWKSRPASWENTRWTGVLEKRAGRWVMAQQHFSFASGS